MRRVVFGVPMLPYVSFTLHAQEAGERISPHRLSPLAGLHSRDHDSGSTESLRDQLGVHLGSFKHEMTQILDLRDSGCPKWREAFSCQVGEAESCQLLRTPSAKISALFLSVPGAGKLHSANLRTSFHFWL
jgi:hypothetical protein